MKFYRLVFEGERALARVFTEMSELESGRSSKGELVGETGAFEYVEVTFAEFEALNSEETYDVSKTGRVAQYMSEVLFKRVMGVLSKHRGYLYEASTRELYKVIRVETFDREESDEVVGEVRFVETGRTRRWEEFV